MNEWSPINAVVEGEPCPFEDLPWFPDLQHGGMSFGMDTWFATEAECWAFIREVILPAVEQPAWKRGEKQ